MEKNKTLLIVEQANSNLSISENQDVIYLEGVFTEFKKRNRNGRIYEAQDFVPKMNELLPKIEKHTLMGELDHPVNFDVSLKNVSHVIESLSYDEENDRIIGKIRLLNNTAGKEAQALVKDGIPLHISSRAAGQINPQTGKVTLEKLFTYDLVADPGFENAELKRVNEAYGYGQYENVYIYECENIQEEKQEKNILEPMNNSINENAVNVTDFQKYTEYIAGVIEGVKTSIDDLKKQIKVNESVVRAPETKIIKQDDSELKEYVNYLAEQIQNVSNHNDYLAEQLQKNCDHNDYMAEQIEKTINYADYLGENVNNSIEYSKYLGEKLDEGYQYNDYLAEQLQKNCDHNDYLAEQLQKNCDYNNYLAEQIQKNCDHNDYLAEQLQKNCDHNDYLAEQIQKNCDHNDYLAEQIQTNCDHNDYLAEKLESVTDYADYLAENLETNFNHNDYLAEQLNNGFKYNDYLAEQIQNVADNSMQINENAQTIQHKVVPSQFRNNVINESIQTKAQVKVNSNDAYKSAITEKLDAILKAQAEAVKEDNFLNFLSEGRQNEFSSLDEPVKQLITEAMNKAAVKNEAQANIVWKSVYESKKGLDLVENMPAIYRDRWNSLSNKRKNEILNEAKYYTLKNTNDIEYFWSTRDLRNETVITERLDTDSASKWNQDKSVQDNHIASILGKTTRNMRGY